MYTLLTENISLVIMSTKTVVNLSKNRFNVAAHYFAWKDKDFPFTWSLKHHVCHGEKSHKLSKN